MKQIRKGWLIAAVVIAILAVICLCGGDIQAFLGGLVLAGITLAIGSRKPKRMETTSSPPTANSDRSPPDSRSTAPVSIPPDIDSTSSSSFGTWDISIHGADGQDVRFDRALFQNLAILSYDPSTRSAEIKGSRGEIYSTSLDRCTCEDFQRRGLPCKHIYKLALARGYSADAFFSARSDVVWYADGCQVYHVRPDCRGLRNRYSRRSTVSMSEYNGLRPCKTCCGSK